MTKSCRAKESHLKSIPTTFITLLVAEIHATWITSFTGTNALCPFDMGVKMWQSLSVVFNQLDDCHWWHLILIINDQMTLMNVTVHPGPVAAALLLQHCITVVPFGVPFHCFKNAKEVKSSERRSQTYPSHLHYSSGYRDRLQRSSCR